MASKNPSYIFFKMRNSLFSFRRDKLKPKQLRLPFSKKVSFKSHPAHISLNKNSIKWLRIYESHIFELQFKILGITGVNLVTEVEQP